MPNMLNGDLMRRPSSFIMCTGRTTLWKSMEMEVIHTSDPQQQRTPDGGKCSDLKVPTSEVSINPNTLMSKDPPTLKEDTSNVMKPRVERSINNGTLSTLTNGRVNPQRENSMKNSDSTSKDHSMLFLL
jgi:hypothetical protein